MSSRSYTIYKEVVVPIIALVVIPFGVTVVANLHAHDVRIAKNEESIRERRDDITEMKRDIKEMLRIIYSLRPKTVE